jgi:hypothetical protein
MVWDMGSLGFLALAVCLGLSLGGPALMTS